MSRAVELYQDAQTLYRAAQLTAVVGVGYLLAQRRTRALAFRIAVRTGYLVARTAITTSIKAGAIWYEEVSRYYQGRKKTVKRTSYGGRPKPPPIKLVQDPKTGRWRPPRGGGGVAAFMLFGGILINSIITSTEEWFEDDDYETTR